MIQIRRVGPLHGLGGFAQQGCRRSDVEDLVADRHADPRGFLPGGAEHAKWQVLDGEVAARRVGAVDEAAPGRIVGFVEDGWHVTPASFCYGEAMDSQSASGRAIVS